MSGNTGGGSGGSTTVDAVYIDLSGDSNPSLFHKSSSCSGAGMSGASAIHLNIFGLNPVVVKGTEEQKAKYFGALTSRPSLAAMALTEPGAGSDAAVVKTTAGRDGDEYVLNGTKCFISNGGIADLTTVFASTDTSAGVRGLSCFLVPKENPGISGGKKERKMGVRASQTSEVILSDCRVPAGDLLGEEGKGFKIAMITLDKARVSVACNSVGIARAAMEAAVPNKAKHIAQADPIGFGRCASSAGGVHRRARTGGDIETVSSGTFRLKASVCPGDSGGPVLLRGTQEIVGVMSMSAMDGDERTAGMSIVARIDAVRPVFAQARAIADGASPAELPPISCP